jgi:hypothetical protein
MAAFGRVGNRHSVRWHDPHPGAPPSPNGNRRIGHLASGNPAYKVPHSVGSSFQLGGYEPFRNLLSLARAGYFTAMDAGSAFVGFTSPAGWHGSGKPEMVPFCFVSFVETSHRGTTPVKK